jgi:hypothetical protein
MIATHFLSIPTRKLRKRKRKILLLKDASIQLGEDFAIAPQTLTLHLESVSMMGQTTIQEQQMKSLKDARQHA